MEIETKEVAVVKSQATKALNAAQELVITDEVSLASATDVLSKMKTVAKMIKDRKEAITKPLMEALNSSRELFKPIESNLAEGERIIKGKMIAYQDAQEKARQAELLKVANRVEKGTMKATTALKKMQEMPQVATNSQGKVGAVAFRLVKKYRVIDESKLPREYMVPDMAKITEALKAGKDVPGAEIYEEKQVAASTKLNADHPLLAQR